MIQRVEALPEQKRKLPHTILAHGEVTGHSHRIKEQDQADVYDTPEGLFLFVSKEGATVIHEEHAAIPLKAGCYRVWRQREYSPEEIRTIRD